MDNTQKTQKSINEELQYLWENRQTLNNEQWNRLVLIVYSALHKFNHSILLNFENLEKSDLIDEFLTDKVYKTDSLSKCNSISYLCYTIFINFLKDKLREKNKYDKRFTNSETITKNISDDDDIEIIPFNYIEEFEGDVNLYTLKDLHLTCNDIKIFAKQWLEKQEFWVKLFLANNCSFNENREALNILAKKYKISSYHNRAKKLGIVWKFPKDFKKYEKTTMIGQWISTLNIEICEENIKVIVEILKILCLTALSLVDEENI